MILDPQTMRHNVILFGEPGVGKSSIINMLRNSDTAAISSSAIGCTLASAGYAGKINGTRFVFWDTMGLNGGEHGSSNDMNAVAALYHLLRKLEGGVSLLVFCMRGPRITDAGRKNWAFFREVVCQSKVPVVIAITHLEMEDTNKWWSENEPLFKLCKIEPSEAVFRTFDQRVDGEFHSDTGVACITATKGRLRAGAYIFEDEYQVSCIKMKRLIFEAYLPDPWKVETIKWFQNVVQGTEQGWLYPMDVEHVAGQGVFGLLERWGLQDQEEAFRIANILNGSLE